MHTRFLLSIWLMVFCQLTIAQSLKRTNIWYFGRNAGLDFNTSPPSPLSDGVLNTWEGCATICDEDGHLLMYTDGSTIWNKKHQVIPTATNLGGNSSSSQSGIIVPKPLSTDSHYVISVDYEGNSGGIQYCEINISANGGSGSVVSKNKRLLARAVEKLTIIPHCNGRHYWVLAHETGNNKFYAWLLTENGIDQANPVISSVGSIHGTSGRSAIGYMRSSPEGSRIAVAINDQSAFELFDFDKKTGKLSNPIRLADNRFYRAYGIEFSPNGKYLYMAGAQTQAIIYQIELGPSTASDLMKTLTVVGRSTYNDFGALQIGSDGRIYIAQDGTPNLSVIATPNQKGIDAGFQENAVKLTRNSGFGLPNLIPSLFVKPISVQLKQSPVSCGTINLQATPNGQAPVTYQWYRNGQVISGATSASLISKESGEYKVEISQNKECDTLRASASTTVTITSRPISKPVITASGQSSLCQGTSITLQITPQDSLHYDWYRNRTKVGSGQNRITVTEAGLYRVKAYNSCDSVYSDSVRVTINAIPASPLGRDTVLCGNQQLVLKPLQSDWSIVWDNGSMNPERTIDQPGTYRAKITANGCTVNDTIQVTGKPDFKFSLGNDVSFCYGESIVLSVPASKPAQSHLTWFNGSRADTLVVNQTGLVWLESDLDGCKYRDSIRVDAKACTNTTAFLPDAFSPNNDGINDTFIPKFSPNAIVSDYSFTIYSRWGNVVFNTHNRQDGWDGGYKEKSSLGDLFTYKLKFLFIDGTTSKWYERKGTVVLIR